MKKIEPTYRTDAFVRPVQTMLTQEQELELFQQLRTYVDSEQHKRAERVLQEIVTHFTPLVTKSVKKMSGYNLEYEEMVSEALLALTEAAYRYDPSKGFRFATYAQSWIKGMLFSFITKNYFMSNVCTNQTNKKLFFALRRYIAQHLREHGEFVLTTELKQKMSEELGASPEDIERMNNIMRQPYESLNEMVGGEDSEMSRQDMLHSDEQSAEDSVMEVNGYKFQSRIVRTALSHLTDRERRIVMKQILSEDGESNTLEVLGNEFGISRERVRQVRNTAMKKVEASIRTQVANSGAQVADFL